MTPFDLSTLGGRIAYARKALDLTQSELAKRAGIGQSSIALLESGSTKMPKHALELAKALQVSLEWLMHGEDAELAERHLDAAPIPEKKYATFASRLTIRREQIGLTQAQLAIKSGLSQATIGNLETGRNKGTKRILELAQALHVTPEWLLHGGNLERAKGDALRRNFGVPDEEQLKVQEMQRMLSMQVTTPTESPFTKAVASANCPAVLPILDWHDKALASPATAHQSHLKKGYFPSPFQHSQTAFWMQVPSDVMEPEYLENDLILIEPEHPVRTGDDIVILASDGTPGFGRLREVFGSQYLEILNPAYPERMHKRQADTHVVGIVNGLVRRPRARK